MPGHSSAIHHYHIRKRVHQKNEKYPPVNELKRSVDKLIYISIVLVPLLNLPQFFKIWIYQDASGVSGFSWMGFAIFTTIWAVYGYIHKEKPILYMNLGLVVIQLLIAVGALLYG